MKISIKKYLLIFIWVIMLFSSYANSVENQSLNGTWLFKFGDDKGWSQVGLDDSQWSRVSVPGLLMQKHKQAPVGWYRLHFDTQNTSQSQALLIESLRHSDETWLNGVNIGGQGKFESNWVFNATNPQRLTRVYKIPEGLLRKKDNQLAIKVAVGFGDAWAALFPGGAGINGGVSIGDADKLSKYHQQEIVKTSSIDVLFLTFALVDILIILLLIKNALGVFPEFKWLVVCSFMMLMGVMSHDFFYIHQLNFVSSNFLLMMTLLCTPMAFAMYFWSQNKDVKVNYIQAMALCNGVVLLSILIPSVPASIKIFSWYVFSAITLLCFSYALYSAIKAVIKKRTGAVAQLLAIVVYIYSVRTQWMIHENLGHRNIQIGSLFYRYALLFAYFQQLANLRVDYKKLSARVVNIAESTRHSIARELHDGLGQHLAAMKMHIQLQNKQLHSTHTDHVESELKEALINLRRVINGLHPMEIDSNCISVALEQKCQSLGNQFPVVFSFKSDRIELGKETEQHVFRIFQECASNAIQHGQATQVDVEMELKQKHIVLVIKDNGIGFDTQIKSLHTADGGFGFISLTERIALLDGSMRVESRTNKGAKVIVMLPISAT